MNTQNLQGTPTKKQPGTPKTRQEHQKLVDEGAQASISNLTRLATLILLQVGYQ